MRAHVELAKMMGVAPKNAFIADVGQSFEITEKGAKLGATVPSGKVMVDGLGVGDVGNVVLRDRKKLAEDGLIIVAVSIDSDTGRLASGPDIVSRGFIYVREAEDLMEELTEVATAILQKYQDYRKVDWMTVKNLLKSSMSDFLYQKTKRSPMILPIILGV